MSIPVSPISIPYQHLICCTFLVPVLLFWIEFKVMVYRNASVYSSVDSDPSKSVSRVLSLGMFLLLV